MHELRRWEAAEEGFDQNFQWMCLRGDRFLCCAVSLCVASRWPVLLPSLAVLLHLFFRHCQGPISTDQKTSRFLFQLHSLPPTSLRQIFKEHRDYLFSLCAAGRLPPRQTLTGIRSECSRFRKVLGSAATCLMVFLPAFPRLLCEQRWLDGGVQAKKEKSSSDFSRKTC